MNDRDVAVKNAKTGYVAIVGMLLANILLATFIFFEINIVNNRGLFLAIGILMTLVYAVTFPTKLLPSGSYLIRCIIFIILPHILVELISTPNTGGVAIAGYVMALIISSFCTYINISYHKKIMTYIKEENLNDYVLFEYKTFKVQEINIYSCAFLFINFFIMLSANTDLVLIVALYINVFVGLTLNFYRTRQALSDKIKMSHYFLESLSTTLAFSLIVIVDVLNLSNYIYIGSIVLMIPTIAMTIMVYKVLDNFMYK